jgi:peptidoglycan/LPS O-acetylase OafA/YrhL
MPHPSTFKIFKYGVTGVDLFFLISGFVIFLTLSNTNKPMDFVVSRFSRLYPAYWTCVTITFLILLLYQLTKGMLQYQLFGDYLANMTMFQSYFRIDDLDTPYWTMIVEMNFYILMLLCFRFSLMQKTELIGFVLVLLVLLKDFYLDASFPHVGKTVAVIFPVLNFVPLFLSGIIFYRLKTGKTTVVRYILLGVCFIAQVFLFSKVRRDSTITSLQYILILAIYYTLFFLFVSGNLRWMVNRVTIFFGSISYSLYLVHYKLGHSFIIPFVQKRTNFFVAFFTALAICIFVAFLVTKYIEQPAMRYLRKRYKLRTSLSPDLP